MSPLKISQEKRKKPLYDSPATSKVIHILELLSKARRGLRISEIVEGIDTNLHTATRILCTLEREGWVRRESEKGPYVLTLRPLHFMAAALNRNDLISNAVQPVRELWEQTGCLVELGVPDQDQMMCVLKMEQEGPVKISTDIGARHRFHCCASGKAVLAWKTDSLWNRLKDQGFSCETPHTITDPALLQEHLVQVRQKGYAIDDEEIAVGVICVGAPVFDFRGDCIAGLHISTLKMSMTMPQMVERFSDAVVETAGQISARMGYVRPG